MSTNVQIAIVVILLAAISILCIIAGSWNDTNRLPPDADPVPDDRSSIKRFNDIMGKRS